LSIDCLVAVDVGDDRQVGIALSGAGGSASPEADGAESAQ